MIEISTKIIFLFRHKRNLTCLGDEYQFFDINRPTPHLRWKLDNEPMIVPTTFISSDKDGRWSLSPRWIQALVCVFIVILIIHEFGSIFVAWFWSCLIFGATKAWVGRRTWSQDYKNLWQSVSFQIKIHWVLQLWA